MTKYFYLLPILPTMLAAAPAEGVTPQLVPLPKTATMGQGVLALTPATRIMATSKELEPLAQVLSDEIFLTTGVRLAAASGKGQPGAVVLQLARTSRARPTRSKWRTLPS